MTLMTQVVDDWMAAQTNVQNLSLMARANLHAKHHPWTPLHHEQWACAVRTQQRECRQCGMTLVALYPAANDEAGQGPVKA